MRGRKILAVFSAFGLFWGLSCALNPQPEPPVALENGSTGTGSPQNGGVISADGGVAGPNPDYSVEAGAKEQDSSTSSDSSAADGGASDGGPEGGDEGGDSSADTRSDAPEEGPTTVD